MTIMSHVHDQGLRSQWPIKTLSVMLGHIEFRLRMVRRCDYVGRMVTLQRFASQVITSSRAKLCGDPAFSLVWLAEAALRRWAGDNKCKWAMKVGQLEVALAIGLGSAIAPTGRALMTSNGIVSYQALGELPFFPLSG